MILATPETYDACARINENGIQDADETGVDRLDLDIVTGPSGIPAADPMIAFSARLSFDTGGFQIVSSTANHLLGSGAGSSVSNQSDPGPDGDGQWTASALDMNSGLSGNTPESGPGTLARVTIESLAVAPAGVYSIAIEEAFHAAPDNTPFGPLAVSGALLAINTGCGEGLLAGPGGKGDESAHVDPAVEAAIKEKGDAQVIVTLRSIAPTTLEAASAMIAQSKPLRDEFVAKQERAALESLRPIEPFPLLTGVIGKVDLDELRIDPGVLAVELDTELKAHKPSPPAGRDMIDL